MNVKVRWTAEYDSVIEVPDGSDHDAIVDYAADIDPTSLGGEYLPNSFEVKSALIITEDEGDVRTDIAS